MGGVILELRSPQKVEGIAADWQPNWSLDNLLSELASIEKKLNVSSNLPFPFTKKQPQEFQASKEDNISRRSFVMHVSDDEIEDTNNDLEDDDHGSLVVKGRRFACDELYLSDDSDDELSLGLQCDLMDGVGLVEAALSQLAHEHQLSVTEEVRNQILALQTVIINENEKFASVIAQVEKEREAKQEVDRKFDLQYRREIAEALDNHLTAVQRDHEHRSQIEERRIRDDAAREEAKRKEKALQEKLWQEKIKAEQEARLEAEKAKAAALEAERKAAEEAASKIAKETLEATTSKSTDNLGEAIGQSTDPGSDSKREIQLSGKVIKASKNALALEERRMQTFKELSNEAIRSGSIQDYHGHGQHISRRIKTISASVENVRTKADELLKLINSPACPQSISILMFAEKVVSQCANPQKSFSGLVFAYCRVIVLVTSKIPAVMDILIAELNRACIYTVPKYISYSMALFQTKEAYYKAIGYVEKDGEIESTDSYIERMSSYMRFYGALVQTEIPGFQNLHGLKEGWAWLARFLNALPTNLYTAVALQSFLEMAGNALYRRYKNQFEKLLVIITEDFLSALKESDQELNAKLVKVKVNIQHYIETKKFKNEPEGLQLKSSLESHYYH